MRDSKMIYSSHRRGVSSVIQAAERAGIRVNRNEECPFYFPQIMMLDGKILEGGKGK